MACKKGAFEACSVLLAYGANIYAVDERQWTPLHYAAYNGYPAICNKLLSFSADTDPKLRDALNSQNKTAFNICKNPPTKLGFRIIWKAAKEGDLDMVRILIREGADINAVTQDLRNSPLHLAAQHGHILIVKYLLELDASTVLKNSQMKTALQLAQESLEKANPQGKITKPPKGSLIDRLKVTVATLQAVDTKA